ncbi:arginine decarboxylase [Nymphaea colorata]|uniref:Arginine decarboxylase n=1 Tax=Nymphaea colorata TaxID=210225 RepID=A0A5K1AF91_9MAGN|nr:arginine decarboxylase [Nymphaea colorata]
MPALACVDAAAPLPPGYAFAGESALPTALPESFDLSGVVIDDDDSTAVKVTAAMATSPWSPDLSASLYKINGWGAPYFSVNAAGNISVRPHGVATMPHAEIDLMKVVRKVTEPKSLGGLGLQLPLIVRLPDVLRDRLESLHSAFESAIHSQGYESHYQGVYPVKCNQDHYIVEDIVEYGRPFRFGLEAGSKPELLLAMSALCKGNPESFLVCNGYKDQEYISLALMARRLGLNTVIVLEQEEELDLVIEVSRRIGVRPVIGLRAKLRTKHSGHFGSTSGEKGKFGLTTLQIISVVRRLERADMLDCLQLLHFHIGSQIPSVDLLSDGVGEAAQIYCELVRLGAGMRVLDIGGGLGIDYDGSRSKMSDMSVGYNLEEYAATVVQAVRYACDRKFVKHPVLCSESGRALVSHHSVLVFEAAPSLPVLDGATPGQHDLRFLMEGLSDEARSDYRNLTAAAVRGDYDTCLAYTEQMKQRCIEEFKEGSLGLEHLAAVDGLCELVAKVVAHGNPAAGSDSPTIRSYHVNLSIFKSLPDLWAIEQLFPIVPIHRHCDRPTVNGVLSDLTCDSDGKVDKFIGGGRTLPLHECRRGEAYYLGMFLGGAYQEALGGLHNLFGSPNVVRVVQSDGPHCFAITGTVPGQSCADVLRVMQHEPALMFEALRVRIEECFHGASAAEEEEEESVAHSLACSFDSTPYLVAAVGDDEWVHCCA